MSGIGQAAPILQIRFLKTAASNLSPAAIAQLAQYIREWKPDEIDHWYFGRDVPNRRIGNEDSLVWHAHLYPNDPKNCENWEAHLEKDHGRSYDRTSNHLMFYSMCVKDPYKHGLLVIRVLAEPDGHTPFGNSALMSSWEEIAFNHQVHGKVA